MWKTLSVAAIAAGVGFAAGRATSPKESEQETVDLRDANRSEASIKDGTIDRTAFAAPDLGPSAGEGKSAADRFCRANGYAVAGDFTCATGDVPCRSFDLIVCEGKSR